MKLIIIILLSQISFCFSFSQTPTTANNVVEGGKILVELVKIFKKNPVQQGLQEQESNSCDICFTNSSTDNLSIELSRKINDSTYKNIPGMLILTTSSHECMLSLSPNVYHYKVFKKLGSTQVSFLEGDMRLAPNEKMEREIR